MPSGLRLRHQHRLLAPQVREHGLQVRDLGQVVVDDVGLGRVQRGVVLVIVLGRIERRCRSRSWSRSACRRRARRRAARCRPWRSSSASSLCGKISERYCVPAVRPLAVELGRVVRDREVDLQDLAVGDDARIERHLHRLGVAGGAAADRVVVRVLLERRRHSPTPRWSRPWCAGTPPARPRSSRRRAPRFQDRRRPRQGCRAWADRCGWRPRNAPRPATARR